MEEKKLKGGSPIMNKLKDFEQSLQEIHSYLNYFHHSEKENKIKTDRIYEKIEQRYHALEERYKTVEMMFFSFSIFAIGILVKLVIWG